MRLFALLVVLLSPLAVDAVTIEVPLTGLDGLYADGEQRFSGVQLIAVPEGELLVGHSLLLEGTTACGATGCVPPVSFTWGSSQQESSGGDFSFQLDAIYTAPLTLESTLPIMVLLRLGAPPPGDGSTSYNGYWGASAAGGPVPPPEPHTSSPAIVTSATLLIVTAAVPEPALSWLLLTGIAAILRQVAIGKRISGP